MFDEIQHSNINVKPKSKVSYFATDKIVIFGFVFSLIANTYTWWLLYTNYKDYSEYVPLHYNIYFGIDLYGPWYQILLIPASGFLIIFINTVLSYILYKRVRLLSIFLLLAMSISQGIFLGASWLITRELIV